MEICHYSEELWKLGVIGRLTTNIDMLNCKVILRL